METSIIPYADTPETRKCIREIFFLSAAARTFANESERDAFFERWTAYYFAKEPRNLWLAVNSGGRILGYLTGCADSAHAAADLVQVNPSYLLFEDLFARFPAHLHINCHPDSRGQGIGSRLVEYFVSRLKGKSGVHIVTSPGLGNVNFYRRNGFTFELVRDWKGKRLLFMGRG